MDEIVRLRAERDSLRRRLAYLEELLVRVERFIQRNGVGARRFFLLVDVQRALRGGDASRDP